MELLGLGGLVLVLVYMDTVFRRKWLFRAVPVQVVFVGLFVGCPSRLLTGFVPFRWLFVGLVCRFLALLVGSSCFQVILLLRGFSGFFVGLALALALAFT